jgi:hypothetical protein
MIFSPTAFKIKICDKLVSWEIRFGFLKKAYWCLIITYNALYLIFQLYKTKYFIIKHHNTNNITYISSLMFAEFLNTLFSTKPEIFPPIADT